MKLLPFLKARKLLLENIDTVNCRKIELGNAAGQVLREPIISDRPLPPFNRSAMDGYAVKSIDIKTGKAMLRCVGSLEAGSELEGSLKRGECLKIMTGAPLPNGADAVIKVEHSSSAGDMVELREPSFEKWLNVHRMGADARKGETVIEKGVCLTPAIMAASAAVGAAKPLVSRKIKVAVIVTGSEVVHPHEKPLPFQVRDSNSPSLLASLSGIPWVDAYFEGILRDEPDIFKKAFRKALSRSDVVIATGGVSMGDRDYTFAAFSGLGVKEVFHKSAIRPGKPLWFGKYGRKAIFGLPGNPVSVAVTFHEYVLPALRKMAGVSSLLPSAFFLPLSSNLRKNHALREFRVAKLGKGGAFVAPVKGYKGSGDFIAASRSDGVVILPEKTRSISAGTIVEFHPWACF